jgi:hypothetical protein
MSANMQDLTPEFRTKVNTALAALAVGRRRGQADTGPQGRRLRFHGRLL